MGYLRCNADSAIAVCDPAYNKTRRKEGQHKHKSPIKIRRFTYSDLESATNNFSPRNLLGKGSHGAVYKAVLDGGKLIAAVKKTNSNFITTNLGTSTTTTAAENEIEILSKIHSSRIVNLIGYASGDEKDRRSSSLLLVVQYMPNGSLYDLIYKRPHPPPGWTVRIRLALQIAKALHALHSATPPIIHRDIKSSNVLIDSKHSAKLSDFGLALRGHVEDVRILSTPPAGTLGYLDPCYLAPGDLSTKSDVFSYGILLLEIISGRRAIDVNYSPPSVVDWALPLIKAGKFSEICDRRIGCLGDGVISKELGMLALRCVRSTARKRPSMKEAVDCLKFVYRWIRTPVWSNLRRRVRSAERGRRVDDDNDDAGDVDETGAAGVVQGVKWWGWSSMHRGKGSSSGRDKKKASSVSSAEETKCMPQGGTKKGAEGGGDRIRRSKSAGSSSETNYKSGRVTNGNVGDSHRHLRNQRVSLIKGKGGEVSLRVSTAVRLGKSRSMSVLYGKDRGGISITVKHINGSGGKMRETMNNPPIKEELDELPLLGGGGNGGGGKAREMPMKNPQMKEELDELPLLVVSEKQ